MTFQLLCAWFHFTYDNSFLALRKKTKKERAQELTCDSIWVMLNKLKSSAPTLLWMRSNFTIVSRLSNGEEVELSFTLNPTPPTYDAAKVIECIPQAILADIDEDFGEYLSIASTVANTINDKIKIVVKEVVEHCRCANKIINTLHNDELDKASLLVDCLIDLLIPYDPLAGDLWAQWLADTLDYIESRVGM